MNLVENPDAHAVISHELLRTYWRNVDDRESAIEAAEGTASLILRNLRKDSERPMFDRLQTCLFNLFSGESTSRSTAVRIFTALELPFG